MEDVRLKIATRNKYKLGNEGLWTSDKYHFNNTTLKLWAQNGSCIQAWLATVLIARGHYQWNSKDQGATWVTQEKGPL